MPEGHTIHRLARDQQRDFSGRKIRVSSPQGRFSEGAATLDGRRLGPVEAHGKHLFYTWSRNRVLHVHLGLYGKFRYHASPPPPPRGQVRLRAVAPEKSFDLNGPAACEIITAAGRDAIRARLGPDPLRDDADPQRVWERIRRSRAPVGKLLLDQSVLAGVGNVYRADALFAVGIHPERPGNTLDRDEFDRLWETIHAMLTIGVRYNRIINTDPKLLGKPRSRMRREERFLVYKQPTCRTCRAKIESWTLAARTIYACPRCQSW